MDRKHFKMAAFGCIAVSVGLIFSACAGSSDQSASSATSSSASSSQSSSQASATSKPTAFRLPVVLAQDLNPLTTSCMINLTLWPLLYDCLAQPDASFTTQKDLATDIQTSGTTVTVTLRSGVTFSDGTALTSADVVYSYDLVKSTSSSYFYADVSNIASITAQGSYKVVFTLNKADALAGNLLDIPIVKSGSVASVRTAPTGSGPYTFSTNQLTATLTHNKNWYGGGTFSFQSVPLVNIYSTDAVQSSLKIGAFNYLFTDYGSGSFSSNNLSTKSVNLNRIIYLGINSSHSGLSNAHVRKAVSLALDRKTMVTDAFSSQALATNLPYNPAWSGGQAPAAADLSAQADKAQSELEAAGYTTMNTAGIITKADGSGALSLTLLVNSGNNEMVSAAGEIKVSLDKIGINVNVSSLPYASYVAALQAGQYDLYLGNIQLTDDMDLSPLLASGGAGAYGVPANSQTLSAFTAWQSGGAIANLTSAFSSETPFVPLCFQTGTVSYTPGLSGTITPTAKNIFYGIATWHY